MLQRLLKFSVLAILLLLLFPNQAQATHNRAGEITYIQTGNLSITAIITTYTKTSSVPADRDSLRLCWGDGTCEFVLRDNGNGTQLPNDIKKNTYTAQHTYAGFATYTMYMSDPNRIKGIQNINPGGSDTVPFHLESTVTLFNPQFGGVNSSPVILQPPVDIACVGQPFLHNPNAYDPDGDSLSYHLIVPYQGVGLIVPGYSFPNQIQPGADNVIDLNEVTGDFLWISPKVPGEFNITMIIVSHRNNNPLDTVIRDMQVLVVDNCDNMPPEVEVEDMEICVIAGETVSFDVIATPPSSEPDQKVSLSAIGGPLLDNFFQNANFTVASGYQDPPLVGTFTWNTACEHISNQYYSVIFRTEDNVPIVTTNDGGLSTDTSYLSSLKTVRIKVVGPPPEDVKVEDITGSIFVSWENPYSCEDAAEEYFRGFTVWRREGSNLFPVDNCDPGLAGKGYTKLTTVPVMESQGDSIYFYLDENVERGKTYCYRILGEFAKLSAAGNEFNKVSSLPSEEKCLQLSRDIPLITNVDVLTTDATNGTMNIRWTKPVAEDLDTIQNMGPYRYQLLRATGITNNNYTAVPGADFTSPTFWQANDTFFVDSGLNTFSTPYSYKVIFSAEGEVFDTTGLASSIFLNIASTDETNILTWQEDVPWENYSYTIFRQNNAGVFQIIGTSTVQEYQDTGLLNGKEYCYFVQSEGSYGIDGIMSPLINNSQESCGIPLDTIPPCPPPLIVSNICDGEVASTDPETFINNLIWENPNNICEETDDVVRYGIYYAAAEGDEFTFIEYIDDSQDTSYQHQPDIGIAGCYAVTAIDTFDNESVFSNIVCVDNCPIYELPNVFTPNGDNANDFFIPFPYRFVDKIELNIFNRWGELVFESENPDINWDGTNQTGDDLAEGVYFYSCKVFEQRVTGVVQASEILSGYIHLIKGR
ncbi:MAG: gliding motility-associated C-terminal domain-containing protein [Saprospiraceae bacterium]